VRVLFLITAALIVHGSLYPWHFHSSSSGGSPFLTLLHSWPYPLNRFVIRDIFLNIAVYVPLGLTASLSVPERRPSWFRIIFPLGFALLLASVIEMIQLFDAGRMCSALDVVSNTSGAAIGIAIASLVPRDAERESLRRITRRLDAMFLLLLWGAWQLFPFFPQLQRTAIADKLVRLRSFHVSVPDAVASLAMSLTIAAVCQALAGPRSMALMVALFAIVPLKVFVHGRTFSWSELLASALVIAAWPLLRRQTNTRLPVAIAALSAVIVLELAPFRLLPTPAPFVWIPFAGALEADNISSLLVLLYKTFFYSAAVWSLWRSRIALSVATATVSALLVCLEGAQRYLPGRVPETTDAVLALLAGLVFYFCRRRE
jgi:VanZ family protein